MTGLQPFDAGVLEAWRDATIAHRERLAAELARIQSDLAETDERIDWLKRGIELAPAETAATPITPDEPAGHDGESPPPEPDRGPERAEADRFVPSSTMAERLDAAASMLLDRGPLALSELADVLTVTINSRKRFGEALDRDDRFRRTGKKVQSGGGGRPSFVYALADDERTAPIGVPDHLVKDASEAAISRRVQRELDREEHAPPPAEPPPDVDGLDELEQTILRLLAARPYLPRELAASLVVNVHTIGAALRKLVSSGLAHGRGDGKFEAVTHVAAEDLAA